MPKRLSTQEVEFFRANGYLLHKRPLLPQAEFAALKRHFEIKVLEWQANTGLTPEHMDVPHFADLDLFRWLLADTVLDLVEDLLGPDLGLWSSHFICKPAGTGKRVPWHEDSAYWGKIVQPMEVITIWLALDPSTPANGCLRVIPGTHNNGYSEYDPVQQPEKHVFQQEIRRGRFDESKAVDCVLAPNECSIHHAKLMHGSNANMSAQRRCGYTMRYLPTTSLFQPMNRHGGPSLHQIYLARGADRAGNTYGDPAQRNYRWMEANAAHRKAEQSLAH